MRTSLILLAILLCSGAQCRAERRDLFTDALTAAVNGASSLVQKVLDPVERGLTDLIEKANQAINGTLNMQQNIVITVISTAQGFAQKFAQDLEAEVKKAFQLGKNVSSCVGNATLKSAGIINKTKTTADSCLKEAIGPLANLTKDLLNVQLQLAQQFLGIPGAVILCAKNGLLEVVHCGLGVAQNVTSKVLMYGSIVNQEGLQVGGLAAQLPLKLPQCGVSAIGYATSQFASLAAESFSCIRNGNSTTA